MNAHLTPYSSPFMGGGHNFSGMNMGTGGTAPYMFGPANTNNTAMAHGGMGHGGHGGHGGGGHR